MFNLAIFLISFTVIVSALEALVARRYFAARGRRWLTNTALMIVGSALGTVLLGTLVTVLPSMLAARGVGVGLVLPLPPLVLWIVGFLLIDVMEYAWHRISHQAHWLWRLHAVHHADPHVDASTTFRGHPIHALLTTIFFLLVVVTLGLPPVVILLHSTVAGIIGILQHSDLRWLPVRLERSAAWIICTPSIHQLHHSQEVRYFGSNFGGLLSIWDRMFGTLKQSDDGAVSHVTFGVAGMPPERAVKLGATLLQPFRSEALSTA